MKSIGADSVPASRSTTTTCSISNISSSCTFGTNDLGRPIRNGNGAITYLGKQQRKESLLGNFRANHRDG
eukprot:scaffold7679_cov403-Prasinococcus_capsulatus_cf.AAC.10